ncbi:hypothetical protein BDN70DRAFT_925877 [Pholiota conissans]|uniref:Heterokaryon incompatibility domain-containing protein n=1 Tax=Pholiota conissans TaxID=109636 RepID=A0A9P5YN70_9AGAR|nr:hypothetical protein BDN70DRAFT_925877 [Pholiota conissans]
MQPNSENDLTPPSGSSVDRTDQNDVGEIKNTQDRALLEALQQFIIPHIGAVANEVEIDEQATHSILLKPAASKLIAAFKEFIASVSSSILPKESPKKGIVIRAELLEKGDLQSESSDEASKVINTPAPESTLWSIIQENPAEFKNPQIDPVLHEMVLRALRKHVFNEMPIRLLRFIPKASHLEISLIEHGAIYEHLVSIMLANIHELGIDKQDRIPENDPLKVDLVVQKVGRYAILSHSWLREAPGEITYGDWHGKNFDESGPGYKKLVNFCKLAWLKHGLTLGWMDTICINKESSSELDESIRSMYKWYCGSDVCIAYLGETQNIPDIHRDTWFTRGWTLQELVAPVVIKFCNRDWDYFNANTTVTDTRSRYIPSNKNSGIMIQIINQISKATSITATEFTTNFCRLPLSRRMQLAASRQVTREEDTAYSLMGIFDVSIATAYGEGGERAFFRLLQAILESTSAGIFDLFNWGGEIIPRRTRLLPPSIQSYLSRSTQIPNLQIFRIQPLEPLVLTHMGIRISVVLMPGIFVKDQDPSSQPIGNYSATTQFSIKKNIFESYFPLFRVLDRRAIDNADGTMTQRLKWTLAVMNIQQRNADIVIPRMCIARVMRKDAFIRNTVHESILETPRPIVFELRDKRGLVIGPTGVKLTSEDLAANGMRFTTFAVFSRYTSDNLRETTSGPREVKEDANNARLNEYILLAPFCSTTTTTTFLTSIPHVASHLDINIGTVIKPPVPSFRP